jgi:hypothetical protein
MCQEAMVRMHMPMEREVVVVEAPSHFSLIRLLAHSGATYRVGLVGARMAQSFVTVQAVVELEDFSRYRTSRFFETYVCNGEVELAVAHKSIHPILEHRTVLSQALRVSFA